MQRKMKFALFGNTYQEHKSAHEPICWKSSGARRHTSVSIVSFMSSFACTQTQI